MRWLAWGCLLAIWMPANGGTLVVHGITVPGVERYESALDGTRDTVLSRAFVPSSEKRHGEVRLVRRDGGLVVQTLLSSKLLKRAVARIRQKEERQWPAEREGHRDSVDYVDAIENAQAEIAERHRDGANDEDRRLNMLIEFIYQPAAAVVAIYEPRTDETDDGFRIIGKQPIAILEPSRQYVFENMKLIVADSLKLPDDEIAVFFEELATPVAQGGR